PVKNQAAASAVFDRNHYGVLEAFGHSEPELGKGNKICIVLDKNWDLEFRLQQFAKINVGVLKYRTPVGQPAIGINEARQADPDSADILNALFCLPQASANAAYDESNHLGRGQFPWFHRDIIGCGDVTDKIGYREDDLVSRNLDSDNMRVVRIQAK